MHGRIRSGLGLVVLLLVGCSFQLRGQAQLPPEMTVTYVQSQTAIGTPPGALSRKLQTLLASNGVTVTRDPTQATATITVLHEGSGWRAMVADRFGIKREYWLIYDASYQVTLSNGKTLIPAEGISASRSLLFDENRVLGFKAAQESLVDSIAEEIAWQIIRRLQALKF